MSNTGRSPKHVVNQNVGWQAKRGAAACKIAKALTKAGYEAKAADHGLAVKISDADGETCTLWMPMSEEEGKPLPSSWLSGVYLWGRTGDEFQAPDDVELADLVTRIVATLR